MAFVTFELMIYIRLLDTMQYSCHHKRFLEIMFAYQNTIQDFIQNKNTKTVVRYIIFQITLISIEINVFLNLSYKLSNKILVSLLGYDEKSNENISMFTCHAVLILVVTYLLCHRPIKSRSSIIDKRFYHKRRLKDFLFYVEVFSTQLKYIKI